jgi:hypothetical protein
MGAAGTGWARLDLLTNSWADERRLPVEWNSRWRDDFVTFLPAHEQGIVSGLYSGARIDAKSPSRWRSCAQGRCATRPRYDRLY